MKNATGLVFLHGAGLNSGIWEDVKPLIQAPALYLDFPGRNDSANGDSRPLASETLVGYADRITCEIEEWNIPDIILVTHSIGGVIGLRVAANLGRRLTGFIGVAAYIPPSGGSFLSCLPIPQRWIMKSLIRILGTKPPESAIRQSLCAGLDQDQTEKIVTGFRSESFRLFNDPCGSPVPDVPCLYIKTLRDKEMPVPLQDAMAANMKNSRIETVDAGHLPMMTDPEKVASAINRFVVDHVG